MGSMVPGFENSTLFFFSSGIKPVLYEPQPFNSWTLNEDTCIWESPTAMPDDGKFYEWNEDTQAWDEVTE